MRLEFEYIALRFLTFEQDGKELLSSLKHEVIKGVDTNLYCQLLLSYYKEYKNTPKDKVTLIEYLNTYASKQNVKIDQSVFDIIIPCINRVYSETHIDIEFTKATVVTAIKANLLKDIEVKYLGRLDNSDSQESYISDVEAVKLIGSDDAYINNQDRWGKPLIAGYDTSKPLTFTKGNPIKFQSVNTWRSNGGFVKPELIVWMSGPKSFKTGTMINLAVGHSRMGLNGYYVDTENGREAIEARFYQNLLTVSEQDVVSVSPEKVKLALSMGKGLGGDYVVDYYPSGQCTVQDVAKRLKELRKDFNFIPDYIIWDYPDNLISSKSHLAKDIVANTQGVYNEIIGLQAKIGVFGHAPTQVNRQAISKKIFTQGDVAKDFSKIANAHGVFALCGTDLERESNLMRVHIVVQRRGIQASLDRFCTIQVKYEYQQADEVVPEVAYNLAMLQKQTLSTQGYTFDSNNRLLFEGQPVYAYDK